MSTSPLPARRKWSGIIRQQRLSGLPVAEFCRRNGIATSSFFPWKRKLARPAAEPCFVEVDIQQLNPVSLPAPVVTSGIELRLGGGRSLVLCRGFDRQLLIEILALLEGLSAEPLKSAEGVT
jgi:hypothetical protein